MFLETYLKFAINLNICVCSLGDGVEVFPVGREQGWCPHQEGAQDIQSWRQKGPLHNQSIKLDSF